MFSGSLSGQAAPFHAAFSLPRFMESLQESLYADLWIRHDRLFGPRFRLLAAALNMDFISIVVRFGLPLPRSECLTGQLRAAPLRNHDGTNVSVSGFRARLLGSPERGAGSLQAQSSRS